MYNSMKFKNFSTLGKIEKQTILDTFNTIFCDCDGVIWHLLSGPIPGAAQTIQHLQKLEKKVMFVTNNSVCTTADHLARFAQCNIKIDETDIIHPAKSICDYLKSINFKGLIYCIGSTPFKTTLKEAGFELEAETNCEISNVQELQEAIHCVDNVKAIVMDIDFNLAVSKLMRAQMQLANKDCLFIAGAADELISFGTKEILGSGPFINVLEKAVKRDAIILGKPGNHLKDILKHYVKTKPSDVLFIGDSLATDIKFGKMCGFKTLLVLSGGTKISDLEHISNANDAPDYIANSLADLI